MADNYQNNNGSYSYGGAGNPVPNQQDNAYTGQAQASRTQYSQQYAPQNAQQANRQAYPVPYPQYTQPTVNYAASAGSYNTKKSGGVNLPTILVSVAAAAVIGLTSGFAGASMGSSGSSSGGQTVIQSDDGSKVIFQAIEHSSSDATQSANSIEDVAGAVADSVVEIITEVVSTNSFMGQYISQGAGSGVIFTTDGYIVTNHHVIDGASNVTVTLRNGTSYTAKIVGDDPQSDLALLKIDATGLTPAVVIENSDNLKVGQTAIAIGNPLGQLGGTVTSGIVSALDREIDIDGETMTLLQTSAAINPGNSGGGLFDINGNLIGIVNAKSSGSDIEGLGFAIPANTVKTVISDLMNYGYVKGRVGLGISVISINNYQTAWMYRVSELGLYISKVESGSDAEAAGLKSGDMIVSFNGTSIESDTDLSAALKKCSVGDTVKLVIRRNSQDYEVEMTLSEYKG